ncbi:cellulose biosynthesis cyclic di-GMP-binding regulatory protein BcsB [Romboutsia sp.]|uniref:cellulose biosynthesis cyclic di-GMP-binding regulatory protein BcsB n=1 Tax=Romboutsia sp. TaxID=1965302 RepID=UPI003F38FBE0
MNKIISLLISLMIILSNTSSVSAYNNVETYKFEQDIPMSGVISSTEKFFKAYENWNVEDAKLNLVFTKSELLDIDYSTITVIVNGTPIYSKKLDGEKQYKDEVEITIPKDIIKPGVNSLVIKSYKTISDKVCRDDSNIANWLVIHKESNINLKYNHGKIENLISKYPEIFAQVDQSQNLDTVIAIPDNSTIEEINSAMNLSLDLGKKLKNNRFKIEVKYESEIKNDDKNIIYIGGIENTSSDILKLITQEEIENIKENAIVKLSNSPYKNKNKKILTIIYDDKESLKKAIQLISSNDLIKNLNKESIYVNKNTDVEDLYKKSNNNNKVYLRDLGYDNALVKGPFSQEVVYDLSIPKSKLSKLGSKVNLDFRYSKNLDFERSLATVYINNIPIGSKKLSLEKADNDNLNINLPEDALNQNYYQMKIVFNLTVLDLECVTREMDNPWAYILNSSYIDFDYKDNKSLNLNSYPYPFVNNGTTNQLEIVIPSNVSSNQLTNIANIVSYIGREVKYNSSQVNIVTDEDFINSNKDKNTIIIGTPSDNKAMKDINDKLNIKFNNDFTGFESNDKIKFIKESGYDKETTTIQHIESPYKKGTSYLVITAINPKDLSIASRYLSEVEYANLLQEDTVIIDRNEVVKNLDFKEDNDNVKEEKEGKNTEIIKLNEDTKIFIVVSVGLLLTLIIATIFLVRKYKK